MRYLTTDRLVLRDWQAQDKEPFTKMNADLEVMRYFPKTLTANESHEMVDEIQRRIDNNGYGLFAVESRKTGEFMGFVGLNHPKIPYFFNPCLEVGWRLDKAYWGQGFATEAGKACLQMAFEKLGFDEVVSFTANINLPSQRVMQRLGMRFDCEFDHPTIQATSPLFKHVLYRINKENFNN